MQASSYCDELLSKFNSIEQILIEDIRRLLREAEVPGTDENACINEVAATLARTGHVSRARSVAFMMGFCRYMARLVEAYGLSVYYTGIMPGKGTITHKLLALASTDIFSDWRGLAGIEERVKRAVERALTLVEESELHAGLIPRSNIMRESDAASSAHAREITESLDQYRRKVEAAKASAVRLLLGLVRWLKLLASSMGLSIERLRPVAETQLIDYKLHVIGTPDLILEDEDARRAIVVEWKTYEATPQQWEMAQAYIYSMLEAIRLGYGTEPTGAYKPPGGMRNLLRALSGRQPDEAMIVPLVIRPSAASGALAYSTHPAVIRGLGLSVKPADVCAVFHLAALSALHLTMLLANVNDNGTCRVDGSKLHIPGGKLVSAYRVTPPTLKDQMIRRLARMPLSYAGNPSRQDRPPCTVCKKAFKPVPPACHRYFAQSDETPLERIVYMYRRAILEEHEMDMIVYRALYGMHPGTLLKASERCVNITFDPKMANPYSISSKQGCALSVAGGSLYRFNIFDSVRVSRDPSQGDALELTVYKPGRLMRIHHVEEMGETVARTSVVREGKPIAVYFVRRLPYYRPITMNVNVFARVEEVTFEGGTLTVKAGLPSPSLRFSLRMFHDYLKTIGCRVDEEGVVCDREDLERIGASVIAVEVTVDLTYMDLRILDLVYRSLRETGEQAGIVDSEEIRELNTTIDNLFNEIYTGIAESHNWG